MRKQLTSLALAAVTFLFFSAGSIGAETKSQGGETFTHAEAGVRFTLPKDWKAEPDGSVITVSTPDDSLQMVFWVPEENTFDAAVADLDKELGKMIKNVKITGKERKDTHNGMPHYGQNGTGDVDGVTIEWSVDVLGAKKTVLILSFAAPGVWEKHAENAGKFIASIRKVE